MIRSVSGFTTLRLAVTASCHLATDGVPHMADGITTASIRIGLDFTIRTAVAAVVVVTLRQARFQRVSPELTIRAAETARFRHERREESIRATARAARARFRPDQLKGARMSRRHLRKLAAAAIREAYLEAAG